MHRLIQIRSEQSVNADRQSTKQQLQVLETKIEAHLGLTQQLSGEISERDYVIEVWVPDTGVEDEFADRGTNDGPGQDADGGSGRLERTHHESMTCR